MYIRIYKKGIKEIQQIGLDDNTKIKDISVYGFTPIDTLKIRDYINIDK